ncbi:MAG TPA: hypothetical protein VN976_00350 [Verrucomicrobiae bacterium]|nr:hypothetical protein [Verrucomicrobiae bacterium]
MAGKVVLALSLAKLFQYLQGLALRMERFTSSAPKAPSAVGRFDQMGFIFFGNRGESDQFPRF